VPEPAQVKPYCRKPAGSFFALAATLEDSQPLHAWGGVSA
jgi:hypothetical protein